MVASLPVETLDSVFVALIALAPRTASFEAGPTGTLGNDGVHHRMPRPTGAPAPGRGKHHSTAARRRSELRPRTVRETTCPVSTVETLNRHGHAAGRDPLGRGHRSVLYDVVDVDAVVDVPELDAGTQPESCGLRRLNSRSEPRGRRADRRDRIADRRAVRHVLNRRGEARPGAVQRPCRGILHRLRVSRHLIPGVLNRGHVCLVLALGRGARVDARERLDRAVERLQARAERRGRLRLARARARLVAGAQHADQDGEANAAGDEDDDPGHLAHDVTVPGLEASA